MKEKIMTATTSYGTIGSYIITVFIYFFIKTLTYLQAYLLVFLTSFTIYMALTALFKREHSEILWRNDEIFSGLLNSFLSEIVYVILALVFGFPK